MKEKKLHLELIRALAMLLVIFNHTGTSGFMLYSVAQQSVFYPVYLFLSVACKPAVPLYWMVSGALLLPKEESIAHVYRHRVLRMVLVLLLFSVGPHLASVILGRTELNLKHVFVTVYSSPMSIATTYWFICAYIGVMMMLPFLRRLVKAMTRREWLYLFLLMFVFRGCIPIAEYLIAQGDLHINRDIMDSLFSMNVVYFMAGYYFEDVLKKEELTAKRCVILLAGGRLSENDSF